jgi:magnesium transporter
MAPAAPANKENAVAQPIANSPAMPREVPGLVAAAVYAEGRRVADIAIEDARSWSRRPGHVVWIGLHEPAESLLRQIQGQFGLHDLAIEDAGKAHQRPKLDQYDDGLFVVARTAQVLDGGIEFGETHIFVGEGYVVSVRHGASVSYANVRRRCESSPSALSHGEDYILYAILDYIVDNYMPVVEAIQGEVEAIEDGILNRRSSQKEVERSYQLRRDLLRLRNAIVPLAEVCRRLEHGDLPAIDLALQPLFRDVTDHVRRVQEEIESLREVLAFAFEASLMTGQSQQTEITRKLAAWAAILAVPTAIAGIYGMNFKHMPELDWAYGYQAVIAVILLVCGFLYWRFRRDKWL